MKHYYFIGDLHGSTLSIENLMRRYPKIQEDADNGDENILICLGDVGANYYLGKRDIRFKEALGEFPFTYFVIRGNHEERATNIIEKNPTDWYSSKFFGNWVNVETDFPYIKYALDKPSIYEIPNPVVEGEVLRALVLPGAYSVDKMYRITLGYQWFKDEQMSQAELMDAQNMCEENDWHFDLVLSHTCPICYEPSDLFIPSIDQNTVDKSMECVFGTIEFQLDYKYWLWGHFHEDRVYPNHKGIMLFTKALDLEMLMKDDIQFI